MLRLPQHAPRTSPLAVLLLAFARLATADDDTEAPPASSSLAAFNLANGLAGAISAAGEVASAASVQSAASAAASAGLSASATATATAAWATKTAGGMEQYTDSNDTVVLHDDLSVTCVAFPLLSLEVEELWRAS